MRLVGYFGGAATHAVQDMGEERGSSHRVPAWLAMKGSRPTVDRPRADVVRRIYGLCLEGTGVDRIASRLNETGVPPMGNRSRHRAGKVWTPSYVRKILTSRAVLGEYAPAGRPPVAGYYPRVIDDATFVAAQAALTGRRTRAGSSVPSPRRPPVTVKSGQTPLPHGETSRPGAGQSVYTARVGTGADVFPGVLALYVPPGSRVADVTYGRGVLWRNIDTSRYAFFPSDLATGTDLGALPHASGSLDALVLDPPYMPTERTGLTAFAAYYGIGRPFVGRRWAEAVLETYRRGMGEADRVLSPRGVMVLKCQDMVCANRQVLVHCDLIAHASGLGWRCEDLFVQVQSNRRPHPQPRQVHARKNHSYFLVLLRAGRRWTGLPRPATR